MNLHLDILLGFPNVTIDLVRHQEDGVYLQLRFLSEESACPHCGSKQTILHQNRPTVVRDLPIFSTPVYLNLPRLQFHCKDCKSYFSQPLEFIDPGRHYTQRYERAIYERVKQTSIQQVAREENLTFDRVQGIFNFCYEKEKKRPLVSGKKD